MPRFNLFFLGLGWLWVGEFVGFMIVLLWFLTQLRLVNRKHPSYRLHFYNTVTDYSCKVVISYSYKVRLQVTYSYKVQLQVTYSDKVQLQVTVTKCSYSFQLQFPVTAVTTVPSKGARSSKYVRRRSVKGKRAPFKVVGPSVPH